jgi:hypothetical protein
MPGPLRNYIDSYNKKTSKEILQQLFISQEFDEDYNHKDSHDYDWVCCTVYNLLREYGAGTLKKKRSEEWYMSHVWNFTDTVFNDEMEIAVLRGETSSSSSSKRKNKDRSIAALDHLERKKIGYKCNTIFARESCGHDETIEYGASEAGKLYDGNEAPKRLEEGFVKLPKCLKDIIVKVNNPEEMQTVGYKKYQVFTPNETYEIDTP